MKKELRTNEVLKKETHKERKPDQGIGEVPKEPLNANEREFLTEILLEKMAFHYAQTAKSLGMLNDLEKRSHATNLLQGDAYNDGVLAFYRCLDKFDKSKFKNKISDISVFGKDQPKRLEYFFLVWAKKIITENLLDDLKVVRSRTIYSTSEQTEEASEEFIPVNEGKEQNTHELYLKILNGLGGETAATKILAEECAQDEELIWYIFNSKIEGIRSKFLINEMLEKNPDVSKDVLAKYLEDESLLSEEEKEIVSRCRAEARNKIKALENRTGKIFMKIRVLVDLSM